MYKYAIGFIVLMVVMCVVADIAFRIEMKNYKKELARKWSIEKGSASGDSGNDSI